MLGPKRCQRVLMIYRRLGKTGLNVSLLSFGTGGPRMFGQNMQMGLDGQRRLVKRALELGINLFDTARGYGESEAILGECLRGVPRDTYHIITKWWMDDNGKVALKDPEELVSAVNESLRLLKTDHIDVFQFHGAMPYQHRVIVEHYYPVVDKMRQEGKVRFTGFSTRFVDDFPQEGALFFLKEDPSLWDTVMLKYGILNQWAAKEILPLALEHDVGVVNMAAARIRLPNPDKLEETISEWKQHGYIETDALPVKNPLGWLVQDGVESVVAAGYKFAADHPGIATVLTGTSGIEHLEENVRAIENPALDSDTTRRLVELFGEIVEYA